MDTDKHDAAEYGANVAIADCNEAEGEALKAELDEYVL